MPKTKVNFDTNGFLTKESLKRVLEFTTSITYDLKAFDPDVFRALTGANVKPVLRNLKEILKTAPDKLWEVRVMVIPGVHEHDVEGMCGFLADIDPKVKLNFLAFRPNFVMEDYLGATDELLEKCVKIARDVGLENVSWSGRPGLPGELPEDVKKIMKKLDFPEQIALPVGFARSHGCDSEPRNCGVCEINQDCPIRSYEPRQIT
jgi:pyruvate formate lyase activating enzyme